mgnify:FL=1
MSEEKDRVDGTADETKAETKSSDHHTEDTYEKVCFMCRRPESKAGKMITFRETSISARLHAEEL